MNILALSVRKQYLYETAKNLRKLLRCGINVITMRRKKLFQHGIG